MKNLTASTAFILLSLFSQPGQTADLATTMVRDTTQVSVAPTDPHRTTPAQTPAIQLAAIGEARVMDAGKLRDAGRAPPDIATAGGLPSTPIALASLLLIFCILIGRRNV